jgi:hypothetical protein
MHRESGKRGKALGWMLRPIGLLSLLGGVKRHQQTNEMVTKTRTNPEYEQYKQAKNAFKSSFDACLAGRQGANQ